MFLIIGIVWIGLGALPLLRVLVGGGGPRTARRVIRSSVMLGVFVVVLIAVNVLFGLSTEFWWFDAVGFGGRFWTEYGVRLLLFGIGAAAGALVFGLGLRGAVPRRKRLLRRVVTAISAIGGALIAGVMANALWQPILMFANRVASPSADPVFGLNMSFYLFTLPLAEAVRGRLITLVILYLASLFLVALVSRPQLKRGYRPLQLLGDERSLRGQLAGSLGLLVLLMAAGRLLDLPALMYSSQGAVTGVGWLESHVLVPVHLIAAGVLAVVAVVLFSGIGSDRWLSAILGLRKTSATGEEAERESAAVGQSAGDRAAGDRAAGTLHLTSESWIAPAVVIGALVLLNPIVPGLMRLVVLDPNEITLEAQYLDNHVAATREAFAIDEENVQETEYAAGRDISAEILSANEATLDNVRLWDWRALHANLEQQQEIRLYYEFHDVDIDRYTYDGQRRQMMLSVREMEKSNLAERSQTWVSLHLKYTHGYGLVALPVNSFLPQGGPDLTVRNIPPESEVPRFELSRPAVYYGERTNDHVYVKTTQQEFDYPSGDENVYTDYAGSGGVSIGGLFRRLAFAWRIDGYRQLFSSYFTPESRIMFRRNILRRASIVAPFLNFDRDPYPVVTEDGRIVYVIDAYTTSRSYPYAERYAGMLEEFIGVNYVRNSVKVVVDAYDGSMQFYVVTPDDPIISTFERIFPELFSPIEEMPADLKRHIRYPTDLLTVQAEMYSVYHMTDTQVFYQREDVWQFATERYRASFQPVEPYYVMLQYPGESDVEFILMLPFTPANKNVVNAWMAGRSDYERYGTLTVYTLPKGVEVLGPRQIEARIDQNTEMSRALSLWSQRGSEVIRGNLLAIPLFNDEGLYILYVEPVYLQAEDAPLPEMKRVVLADQSRVVWDSSFATARRRLLGELPATPGAVEPEQDSSQAAEPSAAEIPSAQLAAEANQAFADYRSAIADGRYTDAGVALERLETLLGRLQER